MGLLGASYPGLSGAGVAIPPEILFPCDFQRPIKTQDSTGATDYNFDQPIILGSQVPCAIQSASGREIELFSQRDVQVSHKVYTTTDVGAQVGDHIIDYRYTPPAYYVVVTTEDMAGYGGIWGIYCWKIQ